ncbi:beta-1,6-N-acetylglucosaminyltransferase [Defluviimonas sp. WL0075]|uniref:Peptide O-xylosyltransferase n=1 Tax=Albidovulum sediminicola TaxID=2984331 RepID=A0ABT2Z4A2_9RHOB|nr:beta-1,6-N-acetylglucosaminyltransferase [Defluviimonas sp. WL0075]MCV2865979.1 beta-1,6-N-acetylglucosaminyltransferase [Defluviimonas sp. WL0075]
MAKIAFILLCHKDPEGVIRQATSLAEAGDCVAIHFDGRSGDDAFARIRQGLEGVAGVTFARRRIKCGWGEWSLVAATLETVRAARRAFPDATHYYMISGDCMAIKPAAQAHAFLDAADVDYIESFDFHQSGWIKTGIREERLIYRHFFNERRRKALFYWSLGLQRRLGLKRPVPAGLRMMIGSQWWCLRRDTIDKLLVFCDARPDVVRFFRATWIPDETFFQTLVRHLVPANEIQARTLTFLAFTDYGMPTTFHDDHYDFLLAQDSLFARKISAGALSLRRRLARQYQQSGVVDASGGGRPTVALMTGLGREGRRFAPRIWEAGGTIGAGRELLVLSCKKWHVAKRLATAIRGVTGVPALDYIFDEAASVLPDLGGIERSLDKRSRHRRAVLRMIFEHYGTDRLAICLDPSNADLIRDCAADPARVRVLEIRTEFSDDYLEGHAHRVGLAGDRTPPSTMLALLPAIRRQFALEGDRLAEAAGAAHMCLDPRARAEDNAATLARFLSIPDEQARKLASTPHLFDD